MRRLQAALAIVLVVMVVEIGVAIAVRNLLPWLVGVLVFAIIYGLIIRR